MKKIWITVLLAAAMSGNLKAEEVGDWNSAYVSVSASYFELKDRINHGFVFIGPDAGLAFGIRNMRAGRYFDYSLSLDGGGKIALDSWGFRWAISPVNFAYAFNVHTANETALYAGPAFFVNYSIQNYPDMHSGWLNWMTNYSLGLHLAGRTNVRGKTLNVQMRNAILSLTSRPESQRDQYYFSLRASDILGDTHSNMRLSPIYDYVQTDLRAEVFLGERSSLAYLFHYTKYVDAPTFQQLSHGLKYTFYFNSITW